MMKKNRLRLATSPIAGLTTADMLQEAERRVVGRIFKDMASWTTSSQTLAPASGFTFSTVTTSRCT